jgi:ribosome maturation factor RimP
VIDSAEDAGEVLIEGAYHLEVSSPGIDRPLTREKDFANWAGHEVRIVMDKAYAGQRVNKGVLGGLDNGMVHMTEVKAGDVRLPLEQIHTARLVLTDALIAATRPLDTSGADELIEEEEKADD